MTITTHLKQGDITYAQRDGHSGWVSEEKTDLPIGTLRLIGNKLHAVGTTFPSSKGFFRKDQYLITWFEQEGIKKPHPTERWTPYGKTPSAQNPWGSS